MHIYCFIHRAIVEKSLYGILLLQWCKVPTEAAILVQWTYGIALRTVSIVSFHISETYLFYNLA